MEKKCNSGLLKKNLIKILLYMKLITFLLLAGLVSVCASTYSQNTRLDLKLENTTLESLFEKIEEISDFYFFYNNEEIKSIEGINLNITGQTIDQILQKVLEGSNLQYKIFDRYIVVSSNVERGSELPNIQGKVDVRGRVTNTQKEPLPGVTVILKGTTTGTVTDANGNYSLAGLENNAVLIFSFVGMRQKEIAVSGQNMINVVLEDEIIGIDEVVAIGYGTMKKSDLTGSISSVPMELLKNQPIRSLGDLLQGRVAGMTISRTSGDLGTPTKIRVRGPNSISGSNEPLTVVDGVIGGSIGSIHDVESIEILKDASATAIYGERASNGVILVTTKKATSEVPTIRISLNTGISYRDTGYPDKMNAAEYAEFLNDFRGSGTFSAEEIENFRKYGGTNWTDVISQAGLKNDHNISYSQKVDKFSIYLSGRYSDEEGTMINSNKGSDYYLRSNVGFQPNKRLTFNLDLKANKLKSKNGGLSTGTDKEDPFFQSIVWSPTEPIWDDEESGIYNKTDNYGSLAYNPYMTAMEQNSFSLSSAFYATLSANYEITDWLTYNVTGYARKSATQKGTYENKWLNENDPQATRSSEDYFNWRLINRVDFNKTFAEAHNITLTGVYEAEADEKWTLEGTGKSMPLPDLASYYNIDISNEQEAESGYGQSSRIAYLGRLNYNYKSRYYFTASYRVDGKSGPEDRVEENKFGGFPSFAVSWRASEEPFINGNDFFDNLKLRFGWGITGNPADPQYTTMSSANFDFGVGADILGYIPGVPANRFVRWEETAQTDIGLDFTILKGRFSLSADYFNKKTTDLLTQQELPGYFGYGGNASYLQNLGEINNKGFEITVDFKPIQTRSFYWDVNVNLFKVKNKVVDLGDQAAFLTGTNGNGYIDVDTYRVEEGLPLGTMWGYKWLGVWSTAEAAEAAKYGEQPGDYKYEDVNKDDAINLADDGQKIGDANPDFTWGLSSMITYKNFDFSILLQGMHGQDVFNLVRAAASTIHADSRTITLKDPATNYWTESNQDAEWPNIHSTSSKKRLNSTRWIEDGSWVKIKYIGLTYHFPKDMITFGDLALSLSAEEVATFTKYKGFDPEVTASENDDLWGGCDFGTQPIPTTITLGVSLEF